MGIAYNAAAQNKAIEKAEQITVQKYYPNPASNIINFQLSSFSQKQCTLQLYNFMGKKVYEAITNLQLFSISLDGFYRGVYIYQLRNKNGKIIDSGKFQVIK